MSPDWTSQILTVICVLLMVTSTVTPVAATGQSTTSPQNTQATTENYDFTSLNSPDTSSPTAPDLGSNPTQPATNLPDYAQPDLEDITVEIGDATRNDNGTLTVPVHVDGEYADGQYPWRIPVTVSLSSGRLADSTIVHLAPGPTNNDYTASAVFTLSYVQDTTTEHQLTARAHSQVGDQDTASDFEPITVNGQSNEQSVTAAGQIQNDDVSEPPHAVSHVTSYKSTVSANGYLEDPSLPVGKESRVTNFTHARDANNKHATFKGFRGDMDIGTLTTSIPNGTSQTLVIQYRALEGEDITVTPIASDGTKIDNDYTLPADPTTDTRCHQADGADTCIFRLSNLETHEIGRQNELILKYNADTETSVALFCQDVITGGMPNTGNVCGIGDISNYAEGRIMSLRATYNGDTISEDQDLNVPEGDTVDLTINVENRGTKELDGTLVISSTDPTNYTPHNEPITLCGSCTQTITKSYTVKDKAVTFYASFEKSREQLTIIPSGLQDDTPPVSVTGGPYIVPLEVQSETKEHLGQQHQTLSTSPGSEWTKIETVGPSDGTDEWDTHIQSAPLIGTINGLESSSDNITYINTYLSALHTDNPTIQDAYADHLSNAKRQLPGNPDDWTLHDIKYTTLKETERSINTQRPPGYGWKRLDKHGEVVTNQYEYKKFRSLTNETNADKNNTVVDSDGSGWVKMDAIPLEKRMTGYHYINSSTDPDQLEDPDNGVDDWERYQFVETRYVTNDASDWEVRYQDEKYDPGGNWTFIQKMDDNTYKYKRPTYSEVDIYTWRKPAYHYYATFRRPITETSYEWERQLYDATLIFQRTDQSNTQYRWEGPRYQWVNQYETQSLQLNGSASYDQGPPGLTGISDYQWEWHDGTNTTQDPSHETTTREYGTPFGVYKPALTVWDRHGNSDKTQTEVKVTECTSGMTSCIPYSAIPDLTARASRDYVDWVTDPVTLEGTIAGDLGGREWVVEVTAPKDNASFKKEIWRSYEIVDGQENLFTSIDPQESFKPGEVEFHVTARPVGSNTPTVTRNVTVYLCHLERTGYHPDGCETDPDIDGPTDGSTDPNPYDKEDDIANNTTIDSDTTPHETWWRTGDDWESNLDVFHMTQMRDDPGTIRLGYESGEFSQLKYTSRGLVAFYDMERDSIQSTGNWAVNDAAPGSNYDALVWADENPNANGGEFWNDAPGADRAPQFGAKGVFGSTGVEYRTDTYGYISFVSPTDTVSSGDGDMRVGDAMSGEFANDVTLSFWAKTTQGRDKEGAYSEHYWAMQDEEPNNIDDHIQDMTIQWGGCTEDYVETVCTVDSVHAFNKFFDPMIGDSNDHYDTFDDNSTKNYVTTDDNTVKAIKTGDNLSAIDSVKNEGWNHYAFVTDGGWESDDSDTVRLYIDGELTWARTVIETSKTDSETASWTVNFDYSTNKMNRFIWGGSWTDLYGLNRVMHGMRFDNIRMYNTALSQSDIQTFENVDSGYLETSPKYLNDSTQEAYSASNMSIGFAGQVPEQGRVDVKVIPWEQDTTGQWVPNNGAATTVTFETTETGGTKFDTTREISLGVDEVAKVSTRIDGATSSPTSLVSIEKVSIQALEYTPEQNNTVPYSRLDVNETDGEIPAGESISAQGLTSTDPDGNIESYQYEVVENDSGATGDTVAVASGSVSDGGEIPEFVHEFTCEGTYDVSLTVTDDDGSSDVNTSTVTATNTAPTADATPDSQSINVGDTASFSSASTDSDGSITSYEWAFHDGTTQFGPGASKTYSSAGTYDVTLTVEDDACASDSETVEVQVVNQPPTADAGPDRYADIGDSILFDGSGSSDPDDSITKYQWDFDGDGVWDYSGADPSRSHSYSSAGSYTAVLQVTDASGQTDRDSASVFISDTILYEDDFSSDKGWAFSSSSGDYGTINGELELGIYKCGYTVASKDIGTYSGTLQFDFDWRTEADQWYESESWTVYEDGVEIHSGGFKSGYSSTYSGHRTTDVDVNGGQITVEYRIDGSSSCSNGDHADTYFYIDDLVVTKK